MFASFVFCPHFDQTACRWTKSVTLLWYNAVSVVLWILYRSLIFSCTHECEHQKNRNSNWDFPWYSTWERRIAVLYHAIKSTWANTHNLPYLRLKMGRLDWILSIFQRVRLAVIFIAWYKISVFSLFQRSAGADTGFFKGRVVGWCLEVAKSMKFENWNFTSRFLIAFCFCVKTSLLAKIHIKKSSAFRFTFKSNSFSEERFCTKTR